MRASKRQRRRSSDGSWVAAEAPPAEPLAEALPDLPLVGLSLAALRAFADQHAGTTHRLHPGAEQLPFEQLTTAQVCVAVVKPATLACGADGADCTYDELMKARAHSVIAPAVAAASWPQKRRPCALRRGARFPRRQGCCDARGLPFVGRATRFVSHAWSYPFADLLAALEAHAEKEAETAYFWIGACGTSYPPGGSASSSRGRRCYGRRRFCYKPAPGGRAATGVVEWCVPQVCG